jgi:NAD(P)-dependent dehydrogenase (short-subunit alcohol dehydrogenase family)
MTKTQTTKIAWVTGASTGIGAAISLDLARDGWTVIATARSHDKLERLASLSSELDGRIIAMPADVTNPASIKSIIDTIESQIGPLHLAILNAGTYTPEDLKTFKAENFKTQIALNLNAIADCLECLLPPMLGRKRGHIAFVSSVAGYRGLPNSLGYGASKAGLINLAEATAIMGKAHGL